MDFEELGYHTALEKCDEERAREICACHLHAYADSLQPGLSSLGSGIQQAKTRGLALYAYLYDRPIPVSDAAMLAHSVGFRAFLLLAALAAIACLAGNATTFTASGCMASGSIPP